KSALMTTATELANSAGPLDEGAGEVEPGSVLDPGLVYGADKDNWFEYLRALGLTYADGSPLSGRDVDAVDLNAPSVAIGSLVGEETVTRSVTNVGSERDTYTAKVEGVHGIAVSVAPASVTLRPGQTASFDVSFSARRSAHYERFAKGSLTWRDQNGHVVTSPIVVRPQFVAAPSDVTSHALSGSATINARAGVTGTLKTTTSGLVGATPIGYALAAGDFNARHPKASHSTAVHTFHVGAAAVAARFDLRAPGSGDDLDLYVYRGSQLVGSATSGTGSEQITLDDPQPGQYDVYAHSASAGLGGISLASLTGWVLPAGGGHHLRVSPDPVTVTGGRPFSLAVSWRGLDTSQRWFGAVDYEDSKRRTFITIN
ncbi:MAG: hypothetical protein ABJA81_07445, partial [Nocardioidaceae bacterium]